MKSLTRIPLRTLQYIEILRLASKLTGSNLLNGCGKKVLDVGCGPGEGLLALRMLGYEVYGFDIDLKSVCKARNLGFKNIMQYDAEFGIPFDVKFDLIT